MQAIILAAGKGTRLHPVTATRSKAMAPVVGKPIVARVIDTFVANKINDFILIISPTDKAIRTHDFRLPTGSRIRYVEQTERLGMANALALATPYIHGPFILSACDNLVPTAHVGALISNHSTNDAEATLSLMEVTRDRIASTGIVEMRDDKILRIVEKPAPEEAPSNISSLPLYAFSPKILSYLPHLTLSPRGEYELQDAIQRLINETGPLAGVFTPSRLQLTNVDDLLVLNRHYLAAQNRHDAAYPADLDPSIKIIEPVKIDEGCTLGTNCTIGPDVTIEAGARIGNNVRICDAIVLRGISIEDKQEIMGQVLS